MIRVRGLGLGMLFAACESLVSGVGSEGSKVNLVASERPR